MNDEYRNGVETRVLALVTAPDPEVRSKGCVRRWLRESGTQRRSAVDHPLVTRVVGFAVATLVVRDDRVSLGGLDAQVGEEQDALDLVRVSFGKGNGQVVAYLPDGGGFETLWFRMLLRHAFRRDWRAANTWRWRNLANTFSVDGQFLGVPLDVAAASVGVAPAEPMSGARMQAACASGDWHAVARGLVDSLNATAALYCALVGVDRDLFQATEVQGL